MTWISTSGKSLNLINNQPSLLNVYYISSVLSISLVDAWAETIITAVSELNDRCKAYMEATTNTIASNHSNASSSSEAINYRLQDLQMRFHELEKKEKVASLRVKELESMNENLTKKSKSEDLERKKAKKQLELKLQESERRQRQQEIEMNRLREKLSQSIERQKKNSKIVQNLSISTTTSTATSTDPIPTPQPVMPPEKLLAAERRIIELEQLNDRLSDELSVMREAFLKAHQQVHELQDCKQNLEFELESRPSVKQYTQQQETIKSLQTRVSDLMLQQANSQELRQLSKFMTTKQRIDIDKRNYELGLSYIDMLPAIELADMIKALCRELDLSQVSDLLPSM
jgi:hypothetical protein